MVDVSMRVVHCIGFCALHALSAGSVHPMVQVCTVVLVRQVMSLQ